MTTKKLAEDFKQAAKKENITKWNIHNCSMCGYECNYRISNESETVAYDPGCYCTGNEYWDARTFQDIANHYNLQNNINVIRKMDEFWGFKEEE